MLPTDRRRPAGAAQTLIEVTVAMAREGRPLMTRILPTDAPAEIWTHYPEDDAVDAITGARWYYHCHPPGERAADEHGHFHLFLDRSDFSRRTKASARPRGRASLRADVVHVAALSVNMDGLPTRLFTTNRWVTDEWLYPAADIAKRLSRYSLSAAPGDPVVNRWLTAAVALFTPEIVQALALRDTALALARVRDPDGDIFEDRELEILSTLDLDLDGAASEALG